MGHATPRLTLLLLAAALACGPGQSVLTDADRALLAKVGVSADFGHALKSRGRNLRQLEVENGDGQRVPASGLTVDVPQARTKRAVRELRVLAPRGFTVFVSGQNFGINGEPDRVSAMAAESFYDVLTAVGTAGWNYDLGPEAVAERLREWDSRYGLVLVGAGGDWLEAEFIRCPTDMLAFAREVYAFCPDVVDQGTGTVEALGEEMRRENAVYLWWD